MAYDTGDQEHPPVTDWINDWHWLDNGWGPNYRLDTSQQTTWANGQIRGPRNVPIILDR